MKILAIETSCDETAVAAVEAQNNKKPVFKILSNIVASQVKLHAKYGGVYPFLAKREHQRNLPIVYKKALRLASLTQGKPSKQTGDFRIDAVTVTVGPGLEPCLWVGINFAKEIAEKLCVSLVPVNHIEAHIFANFINSSELLAPDSKIFPALCLIVSGGHTQLILVKAIGQYKILGETRDDAAGECFDKAARLLGLGYPGGPAIAAESAKYKIQNTRYKVQLPRPMIYQKNYDFSFSGLKTAVLYLVRQLTINKKQLTIIQKREIAAEVQQAIIDVLLSKTIKAAKNYKVKSIILGGGVTANSELRKQFEEKIKKELPGIKYIRPSIEYCTDNAAMVALAGYFQWQGKKKWAKIDADSNLRIG